MLVSCRNYNNGLQHAFLGSRVKSQFGDRDGHGSGNPLCPSHASGQPQAPAQSPVLIPEMIVQSLGTFLLQKLKYINTHSKFFLFQR